MTHSILSTKYLTMWLLLAVFFKGMVTSLIVPLWEFPDEQVHFSQVSHYVETGTTWGKYDVSDEMYLSQLAMGTVRDHWGVNQHTYKAHFRQAYSKSLIGPYEQEIIDQPLSARTEYVKTEAARYPPIYYHLATLGYRLSYSGSIIDRAFGVRAMTVLMAMATAYVALRIGRRVFRSQLLAYSLAIMVSFQPMYSFVSTGTNNDNLLILLSSLIVWVMIVIWQEGLTGNRAMVLALLSGLAILTKPLAAPVLLPLPLLLIIEWWSSRRSLVVELKMLGPALVVGFASGGYLVVGPILIDGTLPFITNQKEYSTLKDLSFLDYIGPQLKRYYSETLVWYWGVFKWLSVVLPLDLIRFIKVTMVVSALGLVLSLRLIKRSTWSMLALLMLWSALYVLAITIWDYDMVRKNGVSHGLQGRYFFPLIVPHMAIMLWGFSHVLMGKAIRAAAALLAIFFVWWHLVSLHVLISSYYELESVRTFLLTLSQYKPVYFKYPWNVLWMIGYAWVLIALLLSLIRISWKTGHEDQVKHTNEKLKH